MARVEHDKVIEACARAMHELHGAFSFAMGDDRKPWRDCSEDEREASRVGVIVVMTGAGAEDQWREWSEERRSKGWTHGPVKDPVSKTHPCLVEKYEQLPASERAKDVLIADAVRALARALTSAAR